MRKALCLAVNKEEIVKYVFKDMGRVSGMWPAVKGSLGWTNTPPYPYNPEEAKRLLAEAGYPNGFTLDVWAYPYSTCPEGSLLMEAIAGYFERIGIKTNIVKGEYTGIRTKLADDTLQNSATIGYLSTDVRRFYIGFYSFFWRSNGTFHILKDPSIDEMIKAAEVADTEEAYTKAASKFFREIYDRYITCPIAEIDVLFATNNRVKDWKFNVAIDFSLLDLTTTGK